MATSIPFPLVFLVVLLLTHPLFSEAGDDDSKCSIGHVGHCYNRAKSLKLKFIAIVTILVASMIGVCLPLFSRKVPFLRPDRDLFVVVKAFASGIILATGFMHVLPDSYDMLTSPCLPKKPWQNFPFTAFITMLSTLVTLMLDSFMLTFQSRLGKKARSDEVFDHASPIANEEPLHKSGCENELASLPTESKLDSTVESTLLRYKIVAQVLEMGIIVHSVVIGLSLGASQNPCTIRPLVAALCFHQLFEGMGLGGCILQAEYKLKTRAIMAFFFSTTTPFGIVLGIALSKVYSDDSPNALIVIGVLNAVSSGLLIYMALVDLLAADFLGPRLQGKAKLQLWAYVAVLLGAGGMSIMAKWA